MGLLARAAAALLLFGGAVAPDDARADGPVAELSGVRVTPRDLHPGLTEVRVEGRIRNLTGVEIGGKGWQLVVRAVEAPEDAGEKDGYAWSAPVEAIPARESRDFPRLAFPAPPAPGTYRLRVTLEHGHDRISKAEEVPLVILWDEDAEIVAVRMEQAPKPGEKVPVSVEVRNAGHGTWGPKVHVACAVSRTESGSDDAGKAAFEVASEPTGKVLAAGAKTTFTYDVTAPSNQEDDSAWTLSWQTYGGEKGATPIGPPKTLRVTVTGVLDVEVRRIDVEDTPLPMKAYKVRTTLENTGTRRWRAREYVLVCDNVVRPKDVARDPKLAFEKELDRDVDVGDEVTLEGTLTTSMYTGDWTLRCTFTKDKKAFGGFRDQKLMVTGGWNAQIVDVRLPEVVPLETYVDITVKVKNTGTAAWFGLPYTYLDVEPVKAASGSRLDDARKAFEFTLTVDKTKRVEPGDTIELRTKRTSPSDAGTWDLRFRMVHDRTPFGGEARRTVTAR